MNSQTNKTVAYRHVVALAAEHELDGCIDDIVGDLSAGTGKKLSGSDECALLVIETGTADTARHNQRLLRDFLKRTRHTFPVIHLMPESLEEYISAVCGFDRKLIDMFQRKNGNLGRQANLCSLAAATLNARYLHYRTQTGRTSGAGNNRRTRLEMEMSLFTGCSGEVGIAGGALTQRTEDTYSHAVIPVVSRQPRLAALPMTVPSKHNCAYKNIFRYFAAPPHRETPGTESFFVLLGHAAGIPVKTGIRPLIGTAALATSLASHETPALHDPLAAGSRRHDFDVDDKNFGSSYAVMFARYIDFTTVYSMLADFKPLLTLSPTGYISDVLHALADKADARTDFRKTQLNTFADSVATAGNDHGRHAAAAVRDAIPTILSSNYRQIRSHAYLQKHWKKLVMHAACQTLQTEV